MTLVHEGDFGTPRAKSKTEVAIEIDELAHLGVGEAKVADCFIERHAQRDADGRADRVAQVARDKGVLPIQVALAWVANQPGITAPIIGASRLEQLDQLIDGLSIRLNDDEQRLVEEPYQPHPVLGNDP